MKIKLLIIAFIAISFVACSEDDDATTDTSADLVGTWIAQDVDYSGTTTTIFEGVSVDADFVGEAYDVDYTLTFTEDPNEVVADGSYSITLTTTVAGETTTQDVPNLEFLGTGTWTRSGDTLTTVSDGETSEIQITELTDTTLVLDSEVTEDLSDPTTGIIITTTIIARLTFTR